MKSQLLTGILLAAAVAGCTVVVPGGPDGGKIMPVIIPVGADALPQPKPLTASVLIVANLQRSSANLADQYTSIITGLNAYLESVRLKVENIGLIASYADQFGPRLLLGQRPGTEPTNSQVLLAALARAADAGASDYNSLLPFIGGSLGNISNEDLPQVLRLLASSGNFEGDGQPRSEAEALIRFGQGLGGAALPPILGGIDRNALFDKPRDLFIVIYLQPLERRCALDSAACLVDGVTPSEILSKTDDAGNAAWLKFSGTGMPAGQVVHVAIATAEGESLPAFRERCGKVPGFPRNLFDVVAPSGNLYYVPLMLALNNAHRGTGHIGDFCELIGENPEEAVKKLGTRVASVVDTH
jgi:hypothetical protein